MAYIGCHVIKGTGYISSIKKSIAFGKKFGIEVGAAQIFAYGPQNTKRNVSDADIEKIKQFIRSWQLKLIVHGSYIDVPFSQSKNGAVAYAAISNIKNEIIISDALGAKGLNIHLANVSPDTVVEFLDRISEIIMKKNIILYFETHACKQNNFSYEKSENINLLFEKVAKKEYKNKIGLCIDTAHLWTCGLDISSYEAMAEWLDELDLENIYSILIHLNDDQGPRGKGKDKHAPITKGQIWEADSGGLRALLEFATRNCCVVILERKDGLDQDFIVLSGLLENLDAN